MYLSKVMTKGYGNHVMVISRLDERSRCYFEIPSPILAQIRISDYM